MPIQPTKPLKITNKQLNFYRGATIDMMIFDAPDIMNTVKSPVKFINTADGRKATVTGMGAV